MMDVFIVDLSNFNEDFVVCVVVKVSEEWGIFQVVNYGILLELIWWLKEVGIKFFEFFEMEKEVVVKLEDFVDVEGYRIKYQKDLEGRNVWVDYFFYCIWFLFRVSYRFWFKFFMDYRY